jgi:hypothetical protein
MVSEWLSSSTSVLHLSHCCLVNCLWHSLALSVLLPTSSLHHIKLSAICVGVGSEHVSCIAFFKL